MALDKLANLVAEIVLRNDDEPKKRLNDQDEALRENECVNPEIGRWVDACDFPFMIETLMLNDKIFQSEFPEIGLSADERKELVSRIEEHCEVCTHCSLKRGYDIEWELRIERAFNENPQDLLKVMVHSNGKI